MKQKRITVGLDFDGVVAYNPLRVVRAPITYAKRVLGHKKKTEFFIPKTPFERFIFYLPHQWSYFPALGTQKLHTLIESKTIEAHIISGRYNYLSPGLHAWLKRNNMTHLFQSIHTNAKDEQPHLFKERMVRQLQLDYFIEDNFDVVEHLVPRVKTNILWIYNIFDRFHPYPRKFPYLGKALDSLW